MTVKRAWMCQTHSPQWESETWLDSSVCVARIVASLEADASALSSVASSQDSLHKQPKKKGIKSSIGRLFGKKEKGRLAHLAHRQVMVDPQGEHWAWQTTSAI